MTSGACVVDELGVVGGFVVGACSAVPLEHAETTSNRMMTITSQRLFPTLKVYVAVAI